MKLIGICSDHAGYTLKEELKTFLLSKGWEVKDYGTNSEDSCDYPDYAHPMAKDIDTLRLSIGLSICGSGNGISMVMNKYPNVRAALCWKPELAELARRHNNANVLSLPARFISSYEAKEILDTFLNVGFEGGRHERRIEKIPISK